MAIPTFIIIADTLYANVGDANNLPMTTLSFKIMDDFSGKKIVVFPDVLAAEQYLKDWFDIAPTSSSSIEIDGYDSIHLSYFELHIHAANNCQVDWELWNEACQPIENHIYKNAPFDGAMFSTVGDEWKHVFDTFNKAPDTVWTIVDGGGGDDEGTEDSGITIEAGISRVNAVGYLITKLPFSKKISILDY